MKSKAINTNLEKLITETKALGAKLTSQHERGASFKHTAKERFEIREIAKKYGFLCSYYGEGKLHTSSVMLKTNQVKKTLEELLEEWAVLEPGAWENETGPKDWFAVANDEGIKAYFGDEKDAFAYRLDKINQYLNK